MALSPAPSRWKDDISSSTDILFSPEANAAIRHTLASATRRSIQKQLWVAVEPHVEIMLTNPNSVGILDSLIRYGTCTTIEALCKVLISRCSVETKDGVEETTPSSGRKQRRNSTAATSTSPNSHIGHQLALHEEGCNVLAALVSRVDDNSEARKEIIKAGLEAISPASFCTSRQIRFLCVELAGDSDYGMIVTKVLEQKVVRDFLSTQLVSSKITNRVLIRSMVSLLRIAQEKGGEEMHRKVSASLLAAIKSGLVSSTPLIVDSSPPKGKKAEPQSAAAPPRPKVDFLKPYTERCSAEDATMMANWMCQWTDLSEYATNNPRVVAAVLKRSDVASAQKLAANICKVIPNPDALLKTTETCRILSVMQERKVAPPHVDDKVLESARSKVLQSTRGAAEATAVVISEKLAATAALRRESVTKLAARAPLAALTGHRLPTIAMSMPLISVEDDDDNVSPKPPQKKRKSEGHAKKK